MNTIISSDDTGINMDASSPRTAQSNGPVVELLQEDQNRAELYRLLSRVLAAPMSDETLEIIRKLSGSDVSSDIGGALCAIGNVAIRTPRNSAEEEYTTLFHGMGSGGEIQPYLSYYLTGFVYEKPLAALREDLRKLGIASTGVSKEPEDHMAFICEVMSGLILGDYNKAASLAYQKNFFSNHLAPWASNFFGDLENAPGSVLYKPIGILGRTFIGIELKAFEMVNN